MPVYKDDLTQIRHMLDFTQKVLAFNKDRSRTDLDSNEILAMATVHLIEMIGEASRFISEEMRQKYPKVAWEAIIGTRNRLAHGYTEVDLDIIWTIVSQDLPLLMRQLQRILREEHV